MKPEGHLPLPSFHAEVAFLTSFLHLQSAKMPQLLSYDEKPVWQLGGAQGMIYWQASDLRYLRSFLGKIPLRVLSLMR